MAIAKKCDRCKKYYDVYGEDNNITDFDLCKECCNQINKWFDNKDAKVVIYKHDTAGYSCEVLRG